MDPHRFRPRLETIEDRITPAISPADVFAAVDTIATTQPALEWIGSHLNSKAVFTARTTLADGLPVVHRTNNAAAAVLSEFMVDLQEAAAANPAAVGTLAALYRQAASYQSAGLENAARAADLAVNQFGAPPESLSPPPPTPPVSPPTVPVVPAPSSPQDDSGMSDSIPSLTAPGWTDVGGGLRSRDVTIGTGDPVGDGDSITVQYTGWLKDNGTEFDTSRDTKQPLTSPLSGLIRGWQIAVPGMRPGGIRQLEIPSELAYGAAGSPPSIPPNADLVFEIKLISSTSE
jgi:hypothetical protein